MKSLVKLVVLLSVSISTVIYTTEVRAADNDLCICQTGSSPVNEIKFFKLGCKTWNATQSCNKKITISIDASIEDVLKSRPEVKSVKLGYVGHWSSARSSVRFIKDQILPSIKKYEVTFDIHNSACLSTDNPYEIRNYFESLGSDADKIQFYGYQAISTGGWDPLLPGKNNFWARIKGDSLEVEFPNCKEYEFEQCMGMYQNGEKGICYDSKNEEYTFLKCQKNSRQVMRSEPSGKGREPVTKEITQTRYEWIKAKPDLTYRTTFDRRKVVIGLDDRDDFDREYTLWPEYTVEKEIQQILEMRSNGRNNSKYIVKSDITKYITEVTDSSGLIWRSKKFSSENDALKYVERINEDVRNILIDEASE